MVQVDSFLQLLDAALSDAMAAGRIPQPTEAQPLRVVDLGCGNAALTFAAYALLAERRGLPTRVVGVDVKAQARERNSGIAGRLGWGGRVAFVEGTIAGADSAIAAELLEARERPLLAAMPAVRFRSSALLARPIA